MWTSTDTTLDEDSVTESTLCQCVHRATSVNFNTPPLTMIAPLLQDSRAKRGRTNKLFFDLVKMICVHRLCLKKRKDTFRTCGSLVALKLSPTDSCPTNSVPPFPPLVCQHQALLPNPEGRACRHSPVIIMIKKYSSENITYRDPTVVSWYLCTVK